MQIPAPTAVSPPEMHIFTAIRIYFDPMNYDDDTVRRAISAAKKWESQNPGRLLADALND